MNLERICFFKLLKVKKQQNYKDLISNQIHKKQYKKPTYKNLKNQN